jgi:UDP-N-acetylglucosamine--N-acetylmuramyl-(pentapeptide) pyrophosphoryl-undecaprenol N-acetylglucosamine transferase
MALYAARKKEIPPAHWNSYRPYAYLEEKMGLAYAAADCVVSRAGSALFEVAAFGIPSVVIPLPEAAGDHQLKNARGYEAAGACVALEEKYVTDRLFVKTIGDILGSPQKRAAMSAAARAFAKPDAAERIAEDIVAIGEQNKARP